MLQMSCVHAPTSSLQHTLGGLPRKGIFVVLEEKEEALSAKHGGGPIFLPCYTLYIPTCHNGI